MPTSDEVEASEPDEGFVYAAALATLTLGMLTAPRPPIHTIGWCRGCPTTHLLGFSPFSFSQHVAGCLALMGRRAGSTGHQVASADTTNPSLDVLAIKTLVRRCRERSASLRKRYRRLKVDEEERTQAPLTIEEQTSELDLVVASCPLCSR